jgi:hypothetical protein
MSQDVQTVVVKDFHVIVKKEVMMFGQEFGLVTKNVMKRNLYAFMMNGVLI